MPILEFTPSSSIVKYINDSNGNRLWTTSRYDVDETVSGQPPLTLASALAKTTTWEIDGNTKQGLLPDGYTQLEYLESTGTQYINTGVVPAGKKIGAIIDFQFTDTSRAAGGIFGSNNSDDSDNCQFTVYNSKWRVKLNTYAVYGAIYDTNRHIARCNMPDGTSLDDTVYTSTQYTIASGNTNNVYVGACNYSNGSTPTYSLVGKLYSAKVYDDTTLVRDFIPAKNSSNVLGMYDLVSGQFFTNAGTGSFTEGPVCPTPTCPLDVRGVGNKTEQLIDLTKVLNGYYYNDSGELVATELARLSDWISANAGETFTFATTITGRPRLRMCFFNANEEYISQENTNQSATLTATAPTNTAFIRVSANYQSTPSIDWNTAMLVKGSTAPTSYIPWGYRVPVKVSGKNLFNIANQIAGQAVQQTFTIQPGTYTLSGNVSSDFTYTNSVWCWRVMSGDIKTLKSYNGFTLGVRNSSTFTVNQESVLSLRFTNVVTAGSITDIMLERGSTATAYAPYTTTTTNLYLSAPLQKVGTYTDSVESDGTLTRGVGVKVFDGTETWTISSDVLFCTSISDMAKEGAFRSTSIVCSHFKVNTSSEVGNCFKVIKNFNCIPDTTLYPDTTSWKAYLAAQYAAGTPVTIYYPLATATTSTITVPTISTAKGTNYIDTETEVKPSNMEVTYRKRPI